MEAGKELNRKLRVARRMCEQAQKEVHRIYNCTLDDIDVAVSNTSSQIDKAIEELNEAVEYMHRMTWKNAEVDAPTQTGGGDGERN